MYMATCKVYNMEKGLPNLKRMLRGFDPTVLGVWGKGFRISRKFRASGFWIFGC